MTTKRRRRIPPPGSTWEALVLRVDAVETKVKGVGENLTTVCARAGIGRSFPVRLRKNPPKTARLIDRMERIADQIVAKKSARTVN